MYNPDEREIIARFKQEGFEYLGNGSYGTAFVKPGDDIVLKVTADSMELDHVEAFEDQKTRVIVPVSGLVRVSEILGYYFMPLLEEVPATIQRTLHAHVMTIEDYFYTGDNEELYAKIPSSTVRRFVQAIRQDYIDHGIETDEIDFHTGNIKSYKGQLKLIDP